MSLTNKAALCLSEQHICSLYLGTGLQSVDIILRALPYLDAAKTKWAVGAQMGALRWAAKDNHPELIARLLKEDSVSKNGAEYFNRALCQATAVEQLAVLNSLLTHSEISEKINRQDNKYLRIVV